MASSRKVTRKMAPGEKGGFTIIEVVLVLAIAGLIFLMVFIALPALQRSQRDTQRRNDIANLASSITRYQTNNNGKLPSNGRIDAVEDGAVADLDTNWPCSSSSSLTANPASCFIRNYLNSVSATTNEFLDPRGWAYGLVIEDLPAGSEKFLTASDYDAHLIYVEKKARCDGEKAVVSNNARDYAILIKLEGSGTYCQDNSD